MITTETQQAVIVKERPILFSVPMIQALLAGRKTQTRRVMKPQPQPFAAKDVPGEFWHIPFVGWPDGRIRRDHMRAMLVHLCPYGKVGDRLWVRETFAYYNTGRYDRPEMGAFYRADGDREGDYNRGRWRPSIHMPRDVSRLTLEITRVRVERVQDITESDIFAEGVGPDPAEIDDWEQAYHVREDFCRLWNSINEKRGFGWTQNCWVWVLEFRRVEDKEP